jgi:hypothetical protein
MPEADFLVCVDRGGAAVLRELRRISIPTQAIVVMML